MNVSVLIKGLELGLNTVNALKVATGGAKDEPTDNGVIGIVTALASVAANVVERIDEGKVVASARDAEVIRKINAELVLANDALAKAIAAV